MPKSDLIRRATRAHAHRCRHRGEVHQQPSPALSSVRRRTVILRNTYGEVARYRYNPRRNRLRYVKAAA